MAHRYYWYEENRVLVGRFQGTVTAHDMPYINDEAVEFLRQGEPPVHVIFDTLELERIPLDIKMVRSALQLFNESNLGWAIIIARNPLFGFFGSTISQMANKPFRVVDDWDEALSTLAKVDLSLAALAYER